MRQPSAFGGGRQSGWGFGVVGGRKGKSSDCSNVFDCLAEADGLDTVAGWSSWIVEDELAVETARSLGKGESVEEGLPEWARVRELVDDGNGHGEVWTAIGVLEPTSECELLPKSASRHVFPLKGGAEVDETDGGGGVEGLCVEVRRSVKVFLTGRSPSLVLVE